MLYIIGAHLLGLSSQTMSLEYTSVALPSTILIYFDRMLNECNIHYFANILVKKCNKIIENNILVSRYIQDICPYN